MKDKKQPIKTESQKAYCRELARQERAFQKRMTPVYYEVHCPVHGFDIISDFDQRKHKYVEVTSCPACDMRKGLIIGQHRPKSVIRKLTKEGYLKYRSNILTSQPG